MSWRSNGGYLGPRPTGPSTAAASGWWDSRSQFRLRRDSQWPVNGDPHWNDVSLLLHMNGSDNSTTFTDASSSPKTVTRVGNPVISTAQSKFGGASGLLASTSDYLTVPASSAFAPGTGDFTIEGWFYQTQEPSSFGSNIWSQTVSGTNYFVVSAGTGGVATPAKQLSFVATASGGGTWISHPTVYSLNTWYHFAVTRSSGAVRLFLNGVASSATTNTINLSDTTRVPTIGRYTHSATQQYVGHLDEIRYTKGVARYVSDFTPSAAEFVESL
jgi:hypothetical protein